MNILNLLDELQTIARNGLHYATNPYDRERYERLMQIVLEYYSQTLHVPSEEVAKHLSAELGYITPKVGADAAIFNDKGEILLVLRSDDQRWCLPCGWSDPNEAPMDTAIRETREETGLEVQALQLVNVFFRPASEHNLHSLIAVVYLCEIVGGSLQLSHEHLDVRYWPIKDVPVWHATHQDYAEAAYKLWQERSID